MQKIWLIALFVSKHLFASQPAETPSQFILRHLGQSEAPTSWGRLVDWRVKILTPGAVIKTKGPGTNFEISNQKGETFIVKSKIEQDVAKTSTLFDRPEFGHNYGPDSEDKKTDCEYCLIGDGCLSLGLYLTGVSNFPAAEFRAFIESPKK